MNADGAAVIWLMRRYLMGLMDPTVLTPEVQLLRYFDEVARVGTASTYRKGEHAPESDETRRLILSLRQSHIDYEDELNCPAGPSLVLNPGSFEAADRFLDGHPKLRSRLDRVGDLIEGFESPFGLELLSTVHWVMTREGLTSPGAVLDAVQGWSQRTRHFSTRHITIAREHLIEKGWIPGLPPPSVATELMEVLRTARKAARKSGMKRSDVTRAVREVRHRKKT